MGGDEIMWNWPNVLTGVGTLLMVIGITITAIYAFRNWNKSLEKDRKEIVFKLLEEYISMGGPGSFDRLSKQAHTNASGLNEIIIFLDVNPGNLISFMAKLGYLLKNNVITLSEIHLYFYNYLYNFERVIVFIHNLSLLQNQLPLDIINDFDYLMNKIGEEKGISELTGIIGTSFSPSPSPSPSPSEGNI